jgi:hypothetical protein
MVFNEWGCPLERRGSGGFQHPERCAVNPLNQVIFTRDGGVVYSNSR